MDRMIDSLTIRDTHALIADLNKKYRIPQKTAEGILYAVQKAQFPPLGNVATKDDIGKVKEDIGDVKGEVRAIKAMLKTFFWVMSSAFSIVFVVLGKLLGIY